LVQIATTNPILETQPGSYHDTRIICQIGSAKFQ